MEILELKNIVAEVKNSVYEFNRMEEINKRIHELEDRTIEITESQHKEKKDFKKKKPQGPVGL